VCRTACLLSVGLAPAGSTTDELADCDTKRRSSHPVLFWAECVRDRIKPCLTSVQYVVDLGRPRPTAADARVNRQPPIHGLTRVCRARLRSWLIRLAELASRLVANSFDLRLNEIERRSPLLLRPHLAILEVRLVRIEILAGRTRSCAPIAGSSGRVVSIPCPARSVRSQLEAQTAEHIIQLLTALVAFIARSLAVAL
jgi:hypothetical protein